MFVHRACGAWLAYLAVTVTSTALGQFVGNVTQRPFVIGSVPVVNNGAVGGVSINPDGVLNLVPVEQLAELRKLRADSVRGAAGDIGRASQLRKVSLRGLELALSAKVDAGQPIPEEMLFLAGLQRVEYVFVYPERQDIVLAGPAEGWQLNERGNVLGKTTGRPVVHLEDLVVALRMIEAAERTGISVSIDPTPEGIRRVQAVAGSAQKPNSALLAKLEQSLGPQKIRISGVPAESRFARVLVSADYHMKRLAMKLSESPVEGLPSYLDLASPRHDINLMPRWWLAADYKSLAKGPDGLTWRIRGPAVRAMTEDSLLKASGGLEATGKSNPQAQKWAEAFTAHYDTLAAKMPIFGELRNCIDLSVVAALVIRENFMLRANYGMPLLLDDEVLKLGKYRVPSQVPSQASLVARGQRSLVALSGGVQVDPFAIVSAEPETVRELAKTRQQAAENYGKRWWWD